MSAVLVYSEKHPLALELLSGGRELADARSASLEVVLLGRSPTEHVTACVAHGAQKVYLVDDPALEQGLPDVYAEALVQLVNHAQADLVMMGSTRRGRALAPRLAQKLKAACVTDALSIGMQDGRLLARRYSLGGNTLKELAITSPVAVAAIVPGTFEATPKFAAAKDMGDDVAMKLALDLSPSRARVLERRKKEIGAVNIEESERVICVGRGVGNQDDLKLIQALVQALNGELAGTRPLAYEYGWLTEDRMIGISGKTVRPQLYVAIGLSGQIQHSVSIRGSKIIVAINKDKNAPIFEMADYGIVGDLYEIVPRLTEVLKSAA